ncbi:type 4 pilus major pilin [Pseudomonas fragariae (ex Marin et al. 2024)]|uniref:type 4 pilus major pilin n=1 Tax=Pseudomonas fragariae (ex Marin et al. 2024) TaxID=3080056 RepID=UPI003F794B6F
MNNDTVIVANSFVPKKAFHGLKHQRGASTIEVVIFILIGVLILVAGLTWFPKLLGSWSNSNELENITSILGTTQTLKTASGYGSSGTNLVTTLLANDGIPETMQKNAGVVYNSWGGSVTVTSTGMGWTVTYNGVPAANCIFLATKGPANNTNSLKINGGSAIKGEVTAAAATTGCSADSNSLAWSGR